MSADRHASKDYLRNARSGYLRLRKVCSWWMLYQWKRTWSRCAMQAMWVGRFLKSYLFQRGVNDHQVQKSTYQSTCHIRGLFHSFKGNRGGLPSGIPVVDSSSEFGMYGSLSIVASHNLAWTWSGDSQIIEFIPFFAARNTKSEKLPFLCGTKW